MIALTIWDWRMTLRGDAFGSRVGDMVSRGEPRWLPNSSKALNFDKKLVLDILMFRTEPHSELVRCIDVWVFCLDLPSMTIGRNCSLGETGDFSSSSVNTSSEVEGLYILILIENLLAQVFCMSKDFLLFSSFTMSVILLGRVCGFFRDAYLSGALKNFPT